MSSIAKVIAALRSGEFKQGMSGLKKELQNEEGDYEARYCCLGVACEMYRQEVGGEWRKYPKEDYHTFIADTENANPGWLPNPVRDWLLGPELRHYVTFDSAFAAMNDQGTSFQGIAKELEIYVEEGLAAAQTYTEEHGEL